MTRGKKLLTRMNGLLADPEHPLLAAAIGIIQDGKPIFSNAVGIRQLPDVAANEDTKYRIASISKLVTAIGVWQLIEQGSIDPSRDVSEYLGFTLRNPHHPHTPITVQMLLSHTSSVRDGGIPGSYNIPYGYPISAFFDADSPCHVAGCWAPEEEPPGYFFAYCNMNYCLLGTIIECVSGERFDRYMTNHIFTPMGLNCGFHVAEMSPEAQAQIGTLYRKLNASGIADPADGTWLPQQDDFTKGYPTQDYAAYAIGTNGSLFGPMGSLRISINELCQIMLMFCHGGSHNGHQILKQETIDRMFTPVWIFDSQRNNGDSYGTLMTCYGMGPHIFTNGNGDRLTADGKLPFAGHTAEAYGLVGGMAFDHRKGNGIVYFAAGLGFDPHDYPGAYSSFYRFEELLLTAAADFAEFQY